MNLNEDKLLISQGGVDSVGNFDIKADVWCKCISFETWKIINLIKFNLDTLTVPSFTL